MEIAGRPDLLVDDEADARAQLSCEALSCLCLRSIRSFQPAQHWLPIFPPFLTQGMMGNLKEMQNVECTASGRTKIWWWWVGGAGGIRDELQNSPLQGNPEAVWRHTQWLYQFLVEHLLPHCSLLNRSQLLIIILLIPGVIFEVCKIFVMWCVDVSDPTLSSDELHVLRFQFRA